MEKIYYSADDIVEMLDISKAKAYGVIRELNNELKSLGYFVVQGKISKAYFDQKWYGLNSKSLQEGA